KRKKREEYVDDDVQLNKILISLGAEDVRLKNLADDKEVTAAQLKDILESLEKLAKLSEAVRRHGGDFETYLGERNSKSGKLPTYLVKVRDGNDETVHYFHDEKAVRQFHHDNLDLNLFDAELGQELLPLGEAPTRSNGSRRRGKLVELHESAAIQKLIAELARKGLKVGHYATSDRSIFELIEGEGEKAVSHPLFSIPEILQKILEIGRRGVQIKRFKGLGEMNAKELFETTMNPEKRKLLKVDLNDDNAVDADKMFTILMGDVVEPRRHGRPKQFFLRKYELDFAAAHNLDLSAGFAAYVRDIITATATSNEVFGFKLMSWYLDDFLGRLRGTGAFGDAGTTDLDLL